VSNNPNFRPQGPTLDSHGRSKVCVFCEIVLLGLLEPADDDRGGMFATRAHDTTCTHRHQRGRPWHKQRHATRRGTEGDKRVWR
jgi:hypothetical protein